MKGLRRGGLGDRNFNDRPVRSLLRLILVGIGMLVDLLVERVLNKTSTNIPIYILLILFLRVSLKSDLTFHALPSIRSLLFDLLELVVTI